MSQDVSVSDSQWGDLLEAVRQGDSGALGEACEYFRAYLLRIAEEGMNASLRSKLGASDIVQKTFLEAQQDLAQFAGNTEAEFRAWLVKLTKHNLVDAARLFNAAQRRDTDREHLIDAGEKQWQIASPDRTPSSLIRRRETDEELARALDQLSQRSREVIELRHQQGLSFVEISHSIGVTEVHARKIWSRALEELREILTVEHSGRPDHLR